MRSKIIEGFMATGHSILGDRTVFMLIILLAIFDDPDPQAVRIREQFRHMLRYVLIQNNFYKNVSAGI